MITLRVVLIVLAFCAWAAPASADDPYPTRPITIVVPFPPGGIADLTARPLAASLERILNQPVVVTNKAGAAGAVGMQSVAIARPDGYTLLLGLVSISLLPQRDALFGRPPSYTRDQFVGIARLHPAPTVPGVHPRLPLAAGDAAAGGRRPEEAPPAHDGRRARHHGRARPARRAVGLTSGAGAPSRQGRQAAAARHLGRQPAGGVSRGADAQGARLRPRVLRVGRVLRPARHPARGVQDVARGRATSRARPRAALGDGQGADTDRLSGRRRVQDVVEIGRASCRERG